MFHFIYENNFFDGIDSSQFVYPIGTKDRRVENGTKSARIQGADKASMSDSSVSDSSSDTEASSDAEEE